MPSKTILDCDPALQEAWPKILKFVNTRHPGYRLRIKETHVAPEEQKDRWNIGRNGLGEISNTEAIMTWDDGTERMSLHNYYPSRALVFTVIDPRGYMVYDNSITTTVATMCTALKLCFLLPDTIAVYTSQKKAK